MRRALLLVFLAACASKQADDDSATGASSDLTTNVLASDIAGLIEGPNGELRVTKRDFTDAILDPASGTLTPTAKAPLGHPIGYDTTYFYYWNQVGDDFYGNKRIYRVGLAAGAAPEQIALVGNGENFPYPAAIVTAGGSVWWTTLPNTCNLGSPDSCWQMEIGRAADGSQQLLTPKLADGTYVGLSQLAFYEGDLYGANSKGVYKVPGGDITKPVEPVCTFPATGFPTKISNSTILAGEPRGAFAVGVKGFVVPLQTKDYESSLGLVKWDCSTQAITPLGPPAQGEVRTFGLTQIVDVVVKGNDVFWLDRQPYDVAHEGADSYYALKKTSF